MKQLTWGCELEFGDIPRWVDIPSHLGSWEYFETDIVNQKEPYWGIAADPLGKDPPFGGEINTVPTKTWQEQVKKIYELIQYFTNLGYPPTVSCVQQFHIHVGLQEYNTNFIRNLVSYCARNQKDFIEITSQFKYDERMTDLAIDFLRDDGGRVASISMYQEMLKYSNDPIECLLQDGTEYDGIHMKRFGINLRSILYNKTLEFRSFRASTDIKTIANCFVVCDRFINAVMSNSKNTFREHFEANKIELPLFEYDHELFTSWQKTKKPKREIQKSRTFIKVNRT